MRTGLAAASFALALAASGFLLIAPTYTGSVNGQTTHATLLEINGQGALVAVALPVAVALAGLLFRARSILVAAAVLLGGFSLIGSMSIGLFYVPSAIAMVLAACRRDARP